MKFIRDYYSIFRALAIAGVLLFLIAGCAGPAAIKVPDEVLVPISTCPAPVLPGRPALAVAALTETSAPAEVMRAYATSLTQCTGYASELETILKTYTKEEKQ